MARRKHKKRPKREADRPAPDTAGRASDDRLRPWLLAGAIALFVARPLFPSEGTADQGDGLPVVMLWLALAVFWMLDAIGRRRFRLRFGAVDAAVAVLVAWHTLSAVWAVANGSPRPAVNMLWQWIGLGIGYFLARQFLVTKRETRAAVAVMIALVVGIAAYGLYQYAWEMPQTRAAYEANPDGMLRDAGMWFPPGSPQRRNFEARLASTEPLATFALTNSLAGLLAPWLVVLVGIGLSRGRRESARTRHWPAVAVCGLTIGACLVLTKSRTGYLATAAGLAVLVLLAYRQRLRIGWKVPLAVAAIVGLIVVGAVASGGLDLPVFSEAPKSVVYRVEYWRSTARIIADHPLLGCGPGNFQGAYTAYKLPQASEEVADPHNFLLEVWATAGTPAMLALVAVLVLFFRKTQNPTGDEPGDETESAGRPDTIRFVYGGALAGMLISVPLGQMTTAPPPLAAVLVALPAATLAVLLLAGWVREGRLPPWLPAVGVGVLLVHLLASGGIGFPGVAGSLWLLLAVGLRGQAARTAAWNVAAGGLVTGVALAVACYATAYGPVVAAQGNLAAARAALAGGRTGRAVEQLEAAAAADPWAAEPHRQLAAIALARWKQTSDDASLARFEHHVAEALRLVPLSSSAWQTAGDWYLDVFAETGQEKHIVRAVEKHRRAVELYPNSPLARAKWAVALDTAEKPAEARREARAALRLDKLTPHADKKLPEELRKDLVELTRGK